MAAGALLIGAVTLLSSCAANPVSGKQDFMLISEQEEIDMGRKVDASVTREYGLYDDPRLTAYVNDMGRRLGKLSHRPQLDYSVKILELNHGDEPARILLERCRLMRESPPPGDWNGVHRIESK